MHQFHLLERSSNREGLLVVHGCPWCAWSHLVSLSIHRIELQLPWSQLMHVSGCNRSSRAAISTATER